MIEKLTGSTEIFQIEFNTLIVHKNIEVELFFSGAKSARPLLGYLGTKIFDGSATSALIPTYQCNLESIQNVCWDTLTNLILNWKCLLIPERYRCYWNLAQLVSGNSESSNLAQAEIFNWLDQNSNRLPRFWLFFNWKISPEGNQERILKHPEMEKNRLIRCEKANPITAFEYRIKSFS